MSKLISTFRHVEISEFRQATLITKMNSYIIYMILFDSYGKKEDHVKKKDQTSIL